MLYFHPIHPFILFIIFILFILFILTTALIAIKQRYALFSSYSNISSSYQLHLLHNFFAIKICIKKILSYPFLNVKKCQGDSAKNARAKVLGQKCSLYFTLFTRYERKMHAAEERMRALGLLTPLSPLMLDEWEIPRDRVVTNRLDKE